MPEGMSRPQRGSNPSNVARTLAKRKRPIAEASIILAEEEGFEPS